MRHPQQMFVEDMLNWALCEMGLDRCFLGRLDNGLKALFEPEHIGKVVGSIPGFVYISIFFQIC
jgi:hypothetical protein